MPDNKRPLSDLLSDLADVVGDLYDENVASLRRLTHDVQGAADIDPAQMTLAEPAAPQPRPRVSTLPDLSGIFAASARPGVPVPAPTAPARPALPPFEALWKTADESIDWTEALASPTPTDGLTPPARWTLYHQQADAVLRGDTAAYLTVLQAANPMADLMPFVSALDVSAQSSDELRASFSTRPDLMEKEPKRYLAGMALRIARDLFAVLPVTRASVTARHGETTPLTVEFTRQELNKVRFAFIDPVEFVTGCGGEFALTAQ